MAAMYVANVLGCSVLQALFWCPICFIYNFEDHSFYSQYIPWASLIDMLNVNMQYVSWVYTVDISLLEPPILHNYNVKSINGQFWWWVYCV